MEVEEEEVEEDEVEEEEDEVGQGEGDWKRVRVEESPDRSE